VAQVKDYYDGFSFDGKHFVYNPFSVLKFFKVYQLQNYWIESGMSSALTEYIRIHQIKPEDYLNSYIRDEVLTAYEIEKAPPKSFLVQSGYLTFKGVDPALGYRLDYPNREVRDSVSNLILQGAYNVDDEASDSLRQRIVMALRERDFKPVFAAMKETLANVPASLYDNTKRNTTLSAANAGDYFDKEAYYHTVILTLLWACGLHVHAEEYTSRGMSDLVLLFEGGVWVIELKKASTAVSLKQIKAKGYAEKYASARYLALVGIEIDTAQKNLKVCEVDSGAETTQSF
jgi:competence protein ComGC